MAKTVKRYDKAYKRQSLLDFKPTGTARLKDNPSAIPILRVKNAL
jgi:hypothetical protein